MDNSDAIMYNKDRNHAPFKTPSTDFVSQWKEKNQGLLKYAGDRAKKSIHAGLKEAPDFMRDADEGTSFENVQNASVKRRLANDANDSKLYNSATMEMIGHLSKENKGPYLKAAQPLKRYIDTKDEFDFKHNNYTTTENVDKTPDENVRQLQRELNEAGYTDKFGQKLKEDGIYAGKTAYADDMRRADNPNTANYTTNKNNEKKFSIENLTENDIEKIGKYVYGNKYNPEILALNITDDGMVEIPKEMASLAGPMAPVYENVYDILKKTKNVASDIKDKAKTVFDEYVPYYFPSKNNTRLSDKGKLGDDDKKYNTTKQTMLKCLSANWFGTNGIEPFQEYIHEFADKFREFDDNSFVKAVLLNKSTGASDMGHNAVMLINKDNQGLVFSFYSTKPNFPKSLLTEAEVRFGVLNAEEVDDLLNAKNKTSLFLVASDNSVRVESYDRVKSYDLPSTGYNMYNAAVNLYDRPGLYSLIARQCDDIAVELLKEGGIQIDQSFIPNLTYEKN